MREGLTPLVTPLERPADPAILTSENGTLSEPRTGPLTVVQEADADHIAGLEQRATEYEERAQAEATLRAYESDWRQFTGWCAANGFAPLPASPTTVRLYLAALAGHRSTRTISRRLTSIRRYHAEAGLEDPTEHPRVRLVWKGIRRTQGWDATQKEPAVTADLRAMIATLDLDRLIGVRDRALLLIGFAGALRRSELVALDVEHVTERQEGLRLFIRRSKRDQEAKGYELGLLYGSDPDTCSVRAYRAWLEAAEITEGPIFRPITRHGRMGDERLSDRAVALVVKRCAKRSGLDPAVLAGHSLRAGFVSAAADAGVHERTIMEHSRHTSIKVMRTYIRTATLFKDNPTGSVGL